MAYEWAAPAGSVIGSIFGGLFQNKSVKDTNRQNLQIARETNAQQMAIARENNAAQLAALRENNEWSRNVALEMFDLENAYNTPAAQKQRLLEAGINPATMYGQGAQFANSGDISTPTPASSGISPSMPSLHVPTMQAPPSVLASMFNNLDVAMSAISKLSSAKLSDTERNRLQSLLSGEVGKLLSETSLNEAKAKLTNIEATLQETYGKARNKAEVQKLIVSATRDLQEAILAGSRNETEKADKLLKDFEGKIRSKELSILEAKAPALIQEAFESVNLIKEQQKTQRSQQASNYASAAESGERKELTREQREQLEKMWKDNLYIRHMEAEEARSKVELLQRTLNAQISYLQNQSILSQAQINSILEDAKRKEKENSLWYFTYIFDKLERSAKAAAGFIPLTNPSGSGNMNVYPSMWSTSTTQP